MEFEIPEIHSCSQLSQRSFPSIAVDLSLNSQTFEDNNYPILLDDQICNDFQIIQENNQSQTTAITPQLQDKSLKQDIQNKNLPFNYHFLSNASSHEYLGLFINENGGDIRFTPSENLISFGYQKQKIAKVIKIKNKPLVELHYQELDESFPYQNEEQFLQKLQKCQNADQYNSIQKQIQLFKQNQNKKNQKISTNFNNRKIPQINKKIHKESQKNNQKSQIGVSKLQQMKLKSKEEIQQQSYMNEVDLINLSYSIMQSELKDSTSIFQYNFGRLNQEKGTIENIRSGYSKQFLEFLGINEDTLSTLILRGQKINLVSGQQNNGSTQDFQHILDTFIYNEKKQSESMVEIVTLDNFAIKIYLKKKYFPMQAKEQIDNNNNYLYYLILTEIDIGLSDLESLIDYRQTFAFDLNNNHQDELNFTKEISQQFEDVEYSVLSQTFIEKYYLDKLFKIQNQQQYHFILSQQNKMIPSYRYI